MNGIFSVDVESNGLWGQIFAIGAIVYDEDGKETARFIGRCPIIGVVDPYVAQEVLPALEGVELNYSTLPDLLKGFAQFYRENKEGADVIAHMGYIVEAWLWREMRNLGLIGNFEAPFPFYDVSGNLQMIGEDPTSVDAYVEKCSLEVGSFSGGAHNPLYDAAVAAVVYRHIIQNLSCPF